MTAMQDSVQLHTAARRYLRDRHAYWADRYGEMRQRVLGDYSAEELDTFPRYQVIDAILEAVERLRPEAIQTAEEMLDRICTAGWNSESVFTKNNSGQIERVAMSQERGNFVAAMKSLSSADLARVQPLPYRRVLGEEEVKDLSSRMQQVWNTEPGGWLPAQGDARDDVVEFQAVEFERGVPATALRTFLRGHGVIALYELREFGPSYEMDLEELEPLYNGAEGFWFSGDLEWILFASHESSISAGGRWLLEEIKRIWPNWAESALAAN